MFGGLVPETVTAFIGSVLADLARAGARGSGQRIANHITNEKPRELVIKMLSFLDRTGEHARAQLLLERLTEALNTNVPDTEDEVVAAMAKLLVYHPDGSIDWQACRREFIWLADRSGDPEGFRQMVNFLKHDPVQQRIKQGWRAIQDADPAVAQAIHDLRTNIEGRWWAR